MELTFEWDARKAKTNWDKHGISFEEAKTVFNDPMLLTYSDEFHSDSEDRMISIGYSIRQRILLVVHTEHDAQNDLLIRIISCRGATPAERKVYDESST
ncbi:MAG: BrnT family toxin [Caldilineaceae bacterium]|nr:BrnT family toxin [Caldilineaceae bacterium]